MNKQRSYAMTTATLLALAVVGVNSAGAQTPKTPEAVTANIPPVSENIDALQSAARQGPCGNGVCNPTETCSTCPADCGVCPPVCGDGTCNGTETCSTCTTDCGQCSVCGDGVCNGGEGCGACPIDCGTCPPPSVCSSDADCVPATCCHPAACVPIVQAPSCDGTACDAGCNPFTMDCGQGYCACQNGQCTAVIFAELLNADGPVATKLSSDPAVTSPELAAPTNLSALGSQGQIDISWEDNSHGETGFEVYRSATGAPDSFDLHTTVDINATAFSDQVLTPDEHFCYQVRAVRVDMSATTYSEFSNIACTTAAPVAIVSFEGVFAGGSHFAPSLRPARRTAGAEGKAGNWECHLRSFHAGPCSIGDDGFLVRHHAG
jgi:hypothetical protein